MSNLLSLLILVLGQNAPPSLERTVRACEAKNAAACVVAGKSTHKAAPDKALAYFEQGCALGDVTGCFGAAWLMSDRKAPQRLDFVRAAKHYEVACDARMKNACNNLAIQYKHGRGVKRDYVRAAALWTKACALGSAVACTDLGWLRDKGLGGSKDSAAAYVGYEKGCVGGDPRGCNNLALLMQSNPGLVEPARLRALLAGACLQGSGLGCSNLGQLVAGGQGGEVDHAGALRYFERGCELDERIGCERLAKALVAQGEAKQARKVWERACTLGSAVGCAAIGREAVGLIGASGSQKAVIEEDINSCDAGLAAACVRAMRYYARKGPQANRERAYHYARKACDAGSKPVCDLLAEARAKSLKSAR